MNRKVISSLATWHFAPTRVSAQNLRDEGIRASRVAVTGNTVVDALGLIARTAAKRPLPIRLAESSRLILVTAHRRENFGAPLEHICSALVEIARRRPDIDIVYPVHPNPQVRETVEARLLDRDRIHLLRPLDYFEFLSLFERAHLILTDSGGIQEEAPFFHKPVLVLRQKTERPEGIAAGVARLAGTERSAIVRETLRILDDSRLHARMSRGRNPYGDGRAAERIAAFLQKRYSARRINHTG
jgi:UDP-N-acetylglucosamine 2-epimerase (non-hydrolysing)